MKVAINKCFGGFGLSPEATLKLYERGMTEIATPVDDYWPVEGRAEQERKYASIGYSATLEEWRKYVSGDRKGRNFFLTVFSPDEKFVLNADRRIKRDHPELIRVIEEMGDAANGMCASLAIVEIPDGIDYEISEYDGNEQITRPR